MITRSWTVSIEVPVPMTSSRWLYGSGRTPEAALADLKVKIEEALGTRTEIEEFLKQVQASLE